MTLSSVNERGPIIDGEEPVRTFDEKQPFETRDGRKVVGFRQRACIWHTFLYVGLVDGRRERWAPNGQWAPWLKAHPLDLINVARAASADQHQGWDPITTAPKDGTHIIGARWDLVWRDVGKYSFDARFSGDWLEDEYGHPVKLTHWRLLIDAQHVEPGS